MSVLGEVFLPYFQLLHRLTVCVHHFFQAEDPLRFTPPSRMDVVGSFLLRTQLKVRNFVPCGESVVSRMRTKCKTLDRR